MKKSKVFTKEDLIIFSRQLALIIDSDISLYEGLKLIEEKSENPNMKNVITTMLTSVGKGQSLSEAMSGQDKSFPPFIRTMVKIGEESGELNKTLNQIADTYEKEIETTAKVRSAITYPLILAVLMFGVIIVLVLKVLPMFNDILKSLGGEMPLMTQIIMNFSLWFGQHFFIILIVIATMIALFMYLKRTPSGKAYYDKIKLKLPIQGDIVSAIAAVRFSRNLSLLIKSGINIGMGMQLIAPIFDNIHISNKINTAADEINSGSSVDKTIENLNLFPWVLIKLFSIAQTTGHIDGVLDKAAHTMEKELDYRLDRLTTVIEPLLIIILSSIVGIILISVILPIVGIMNAIG